MRNTVKLSQVFLCIGNNIMRNFSIRVKCIVVDNHKLHESMKVL